MYEVGFELFSFECVIGILPFERQTPQSLLVDVHLRYKESEIEEFVDYVAIANMTKQIAQEGRFGLLEEYAQALAKAFFTAFNPSEVRICLRKPAAIPSARCAKVVFHKMRDL